MQSQKNVLIIDPSPDFGELLAGFLDEKGLSGHHFFHGLKAMHALKSMPFSLVITDLRLPDIEAHDLLKYIRSNHPDLPIVIATAYGDIRTAVQAIKRGVSDYITKPIIPEELWTVVKKLIETQASVPKSKQPSAKAEKYFRGKSPASRKMLKHIRLVAPTHMTVIIQGETGAGKEVAARTLHERSERAEGPFIAVDCGALTENLAGSELFGHVKGAFTGAIAAKKGVFELARGGTLFLDEIGNLNYDIQIRLLRVLQERKITKLGGVKNIKVDVRLVVATNENLSEAVDKGDFREDLYYRLNEFKIEVPSLRERALEIPDFSMFFLKRSNKDLGKKIKGFTGEAQRLLLAYDWPGNLRELKNVITRATLLCQEALIDVLHFPPEVQESLNRQDRVVHADIHELKEATEQAEYEAIMEALRISGFNKSQTARDLGIDRKTLYNKLKLFKERGFFSEPV